MIRHSVCTGRTFSTSSIQREVIQAQGHTGSNQNCTVSRSAGCAVMTAATAAPGPAFPAGSRALGGPPGHEHRGQAKRYQRQRNRAPPVLPEGGQAVAALPPGPEDAKQQEDGASDLADPAHGLRLALPQLLGHPAFIDLRTAGHHASRTRSTSVPARSAAAAQAASTPSPAHGLIGRGPRPVLAWISRPAVIGPTWSGWRFTPALPPPPAGRRDTHNRPSTAPM